MSQLYCLDTGFFINSWRKHYAPAVFPKLWEEVDRLMKAGAVVSCRAVFEELEKKDDEILEWAKLRREYFRYPTESDLISLGQLMAKLPNIAAQGKTRNEADPFVVVQSQSLDAIVVTTEEPQDRCSPTKPPKIPYVCDQVGVAWATPCSFLEGCGVVLE